MSALNPAFLWWLLVLLPAVVLHLVRPRPRTVLTTTLVFFLALDRRQADHPWLQRLKRLLALLLSLALLTAAVGAGGRLVFGGSSEAVHGVVLLVDRSASMAARDDHGRTRLDGARERALARLSGLPADVPVTVLAYDQRPVLVLARTRDRSAVERAVASIVPRPINADATPALALARRLAAVDAPAAVWQISDGLAADDAPATATGVTLTTIAAPMATLRNVGITAAGLRRLPLERNRCSVFVQIDASGPPDLEADLDVQLDGRPIEIRHLTLHPGTPERLSIPLTAGDGRRLRLSVHTDDDRLAADNEVLLDLPPLRTLRILVVSPQADPFATLALATCASSDELAITSLTPDAWSPDLACDLLVCDGWLPAILPAALPLIVIDPPTAVAGIAVHRLAGDGLPIESPRVLDPEHPLLYGINPRRLALTQTAVISGESGVDPLWASPAGTLLAAATENGRRLVVLAVAPARSEQLPLSTAFPVLIANAVGWTTQDDDETPAVLRSGSLLDLTCDPLWDGAPATSTSTSELRPRELDRVGAWTAGDRSGTTALLSQADSVLPEGDATSEISALFGAGGELTRSALWLALALLLIESWLYHRRGVV